MQAHIVTHDTAGVRAMRRDPSFPDAEPDLSVLNGHLSELRAWVDRAIRIANQNKQLLETEQGRAAYTAFRELTTHVAHAYAGETCDHEWPGGGDCHRLIVGHVGFDGQFCDLHIEHARNREAEQ